MRNEIEDGMGFAGLVATASAEECPRCRNEREIDYSIALQRAIEYHCKGMVIPEAIFKQCPHHAGMLNDNLNDVSLKTLGKICSLPKP